MDVDPRKLNADLWENIYAQGIVQTYPDDVFVRVSHRLFDPRRHPRLLDYGFGSGQHMVHFLKRGFDVRGVEVSPSAAKAAARLFATLDGPSPELKVMTDATIPYPDAFFDGVVAWGVLEYNDWDGLTKAVSEIDRVLRPGGVFLGTIHAPGIAPGDDARRNFLALGGGQFALDVATGGQQGARVMVIEPGDLQRCFPGRPLTVGHYEYSFGSLYARRWIVSYEQS